MTTNNTTKIAYLGHDAEGIQIGAENFHTTVPYTDKDILEWAEGEGLIYGFARVNGQFHAITDILHDGDRDQDEEETMTAPEYIDSLSNEQLLEYALTTVCGHLFSRVFTVVDRGAMLVQGVDRRSDIQINTYEIMAA